MMIREMITSIRAKAVPGARGAGLVKECVAIEARFRRHTSSWQPHIDRSKSHIIDSLQQVDPSKPVLVLGAGPCLDLPLTELAAHPAGATLVDAVLLPSTRKRVAEYPGLDFKLADISGCLIPSGKRIEIPDQAPIDVSGYGLIISANILSQLPLAFAEVPAETKEDKVIMRALQASHIKALQASGVPALIISDYKAKFSLPGGIKEYNTIDSVISSIDCVDSWRWPVAPPGELGAQSELCLTVGVWQLNWETSCLR